MGSLIEPDQATTDPTGVMMPVSPNSRAGGGNNTPGETTGATSNNSDNTPNLNGSDDSEREQSKRSRRKTMQNLKRRYADLRERAQLAGLIHTESEGAVRSEKVQTSEQPQPKLVERAIRSGWKVPEETKPILVDEMTAMIEDEETSDKTKIQAFRALLTADKQQYEKDNPTVKSGGGQVNVSIQTNIAAVDVLRQSLSKQPPQQISE